MKKIYLVDVSSMFFRAFYAIRPLTSPAGVPVNAVYGFLSMMVKLLREEKPEYVVFCYDRKEPSFRKEMYTEYKANRSEMPDDLQLQMPYLKKLPSLLGIPALEIPSFEADDIIGAMVKRAREHNFEALIISGDKDFGQLVQEGVVLYDTMKEIKYDSNAVKEKWGVWPNQMIDYLALVGDTSDNIPGVLGIGPKGACKLIEQFGSVEEIYKNLDKVESKSIREKLEKSRDDAFLSKKLVTIVDEVGLPDGMDEFRLRPMDRDGLRAFLQELNFKAFEKSLLEGAADGATFAHMTGQASAKFSSSKTAENPAAKAPEAFSMDNVAEKSANVISAAALAEVLPAGSEVWGFLSEEQVFIASGETVYTLEGDPKLLGPLLDQKNLRWTGFDLKNVWHKIGAINPVPEWDSMLAAYAIQTSDRSKEEKIFSEYLGADLPELTSPEKRFAAHKELRARLTKELAEKHAESIYKELDLPLVSILLKMENLGIRLDKKQLAIQSKDLEGDLAVLTKEIHKLAGEEFNIGSPKQLGTILFEKLGLEATKKTKTGFSTDTDVLEKLDHEIGAKVLQWRELSKLKGTYVDALPLMVDANDRVHTRFDQALTATGRLSSTAPNLQNIPIRTERGRRIRKAFIADAGKKLLSADYSQIELRILAHISGDPGLTKAFAEDLDIHSATASEVFGVGLKDVTDEQRRAAKAVNFGIAYGQGAFGLAEVLGIGRSEAQDIIKRYFDKFKGVGEYIESTIRVAHEKGYVETLLGRKRYITELAAKNPALKKFGERAAINAPIQGTAADLVKQAMIQVAAEVSIPMLLQVHDELIFEAPEAELLKWAPKIVSVMEKVSSLKVPLKVNYAIGDNWDEAH